MTVNKYTVQQIEDAINWWRANGKDGRPAPDDPVGVYLCREVALLAGPYGWLIATGEQEVAEGERLSKACAGAIEEALRHVNGNVVE